MSAFLIPDIPILYSGILYHFSLGAIEIDYYGMEMIGVIK